VVLIYNRGPEHPDFLEFEASALAAQGQPEKSIALYQKVIDDRILTKGPYSRETCESYYKLAGVLNSVKRYGEALELFQKCLAGETNFVEQDDPRVLKTKMSIALMKMRLGRFQEAEDDVRAVYETRLRIFGPVHTDTLNTLHWICVVERQQKRYKEAESDLRNLLDLCAQVYGPGGHGELAISARQGLDCVLELQGKTAEREDILRDIITRQKALLGSEHEATLSSLTSLGIVLCQCGKYKESIGVSQPLVEVQERVFGPTHETTITNLDSLGTALSHDGQFDEAEKTLRLAIERSELTKGPENMTTLMIIKHLANALALCKPVPKYEEAAPIYGRVLTGFRTLLPADDQKIKSLELEYETMMAKQKVEIAIVQVQET
jgi:tetratricopeptide (TPR) repeat protein